MKKFDKTIKMILEAPIVNLDVDGIEDGGYDRSSLKFINNPKFKQQIERGWAKSRGNFDIKFVGGDASNTVEHGIVTNDEISTLLGIDNFKPNPDVITVFFTNNKGAELKPITPWIAAHRFGHALRAGIIREGRLKAMINDLENVFLNMVNLYLESFGFPRSIYPNKINQFIMSIKIPKEISRLIVNRIGTMRSARQESIDRPFEFFYEIIAQHLTTGKVTLNRDPKPIEHEGQTYTFDNINESGIQMLEAQFLNKINHLLDYSTGKVFIM